MGACPEGLRKTESPEEVLRRLREDTRRWRQQERLRPCMASGTSALDAWLGGGWPVGKVAELVGPHSSGRTTAAVATVAAATARGEVVAWIDAGDTLDPASLAAAGVDLARVLWVRPATHEQVVRAAELVLDAGGFTLVVADLSVPLGVSTPNRMSGGTQQRRPGPGPVPSPGPGPGPSPGSPGWRGGGGGAGGIAVWGVRGRALDSRLSTGWVGGEALDSQLSTGWAGGEALDSQLSTGWAGGEALDSRLSTGWVGGKPSTFDLRPSTGRAGGGLSTGRAGGRGVLALRLARVVERARVVALVLAERPWMGGLAGVMVHLQGGGVHWLGGVRNGPRWLAGVMLRPGQNAGRSPHFSPEFVASGRRS